MTALNRTLGSYQFCTPEAVSSGSQAQMHFFVADAKADIAMLASALRDCQAALATLIVPDNIKATSIVNAFAQCTAAEAKARVILGITP